MLLQDRQSQKFYGNRTQWVDDKRDAVDFDRIDLAEAVATVEHLATIEIVFAYDDFSCELTLPVAFSDVRRS